MKYEILGVVEFSSIAGGIEALDNMVKAAPVEILSAGMLNPGKYLILISGNLASVEIAMDAGILVGRDSLIDHVLISRLDPQIFPAFNGVIEPDEWDALGILETLSAASAIEAADRAVKTGGVTLLSLSTGNELGGKAVFRISGALGDIQAAMTVAEELTGEKGKLLKGVVIPGPHGEIKEFVCGN